MAEWWSKVIFWTANVVAVSIVLWVVSVYAYNINEGDPVLPIIPVLFAGVVWLAGWVCRNLFVRR
jgi:hypothetical protein